MLKQYYWGLGVNLKIIWKKVVCMNNKDLLKAIGDIDDRYLIEEKKLS